MVMPQLIIANILLAIFIAVTGMVSAFLVKACWRWMKLVQALAAIFVLITYYVILTSPEYPVYLARISTTVLLVNISAGSIGTLSRIWASRTLVKDIRFGHSFLDRIDSTWIGSATRKKLNPTENRVQH